MISNIVKVPCRPVNTVNTKLQQKYDIKGENMAKKLTPHVNRLHRTFMRHVRYLLLMVYKENHLATFNNFQIYFLLHVFQVAEELDCHVPIVPAKATNSFTIDDIRFDSKKCKTLEQKNNLKYLVDTIQGALSESLNENGILNINECKGFIKQIEAFENQTELKDDFKSLYDHYLPQTELLTKLRELFDKSKTSPSKNDIKNIVDKIKRAYPSTSPFKNFLDTYILYVLDKQDDYADSINSFINLTVPQYFLFFQCYGNFMDSKENFNSLKTSDIEFTYYYCNFLTELIPFLNTLIPKSFTDSSIEQPNYNSKKDICKPLKTSKYINISFYNDLMHVLDYWENTELSNYLIQEKRSSTEIDFKNTFLSFISCFVASEDLIFNNDIEQAKKFREKLTSCIELVLEIHTPGRLFDEMGMSRANAKKWFDIPIEELAKSRINRNSIKNLSDTTGCSIGFFMNKTDDPLDFKYDYDIKGDQLLYNELFQFIEPPLDASIKRLFRKIDAEKKTFNQEELQYFKNMLLEKANAL